MRRLLTLLLLPVLCGCASRAPQPNFIVILADDFGAECVGAYGGTSYETPNLDRLAADGVRFANAFTQPLCTPTRVELLTGRSNARNYTAFSVLDPGEVTFAHALRERGYATCAVGKWQLLGASHYQPPVRGAGSTPVQAGFDSHALWQVESLGSRHWAPVLTIDGETTAFPDDRYGPDVVFDHAIDWMRSVRGRPFLLFWPMILPHDPFIAPPGYDGPRSRPGDIAQYANMVAHLDLLVGRLRSFLEAEGLADDSIVIFIGDNGSPRPVRSMRDGIEVRGAKARPHDAGSRVPFIAWGPGRVAGGRVDTHLASSVDVFATLFEASGGTASPDPALDSVSMWARLEGDGGPTRDAVAFHHHPRPVTRPGSAPLRWARDARWQLFDDGRFFDMEADPTMQHPLDTDALDAEAAAAHDALARALDALPPARRSPLLLESP